MFPEEVIRMRDEINCPLSVCQKALKICEGDYELAKEFIRLKYLGVFRCKIVDGERIPFNDHDYLELARKKVGCKQ